MPSVPEICESCGAEETTHEVRRVYVTPEAWDREGSVRPAEETERWCGTCVLHYPHQPIDA